MRDKDLYQKTFSQLHSSRTIRWEDYQMKQKKHKHIRTVVMAAAVAAILAALSTVGLAANWFGLRGLLLPGEHTITIPPVEGSDDEPVTENVSLISLAGFQGSVEAMAAAEWEAFCASYGYPGGEEGFPETEFYQVYDQTMRDKLHEIADKYGLKLHTDLDIISQEETFHRVGGAFLSDEHLGGWSYIMEDGSFQFDGGYRGQSNVNYQFRRAVKGSLDGVLLNINNVNTYTQWVYDTASGEQVLLALGPSKAMILADFPACFITVNVLAGDDPENGLWPGNMTREELENIADSIDFAILKDVKTPEMRGDSVPEDPALWSPASENYLPPEGWEQIYYSTNITAEEAQAIYETLCWAIDTGDRRTIAELFSYPCTLTIGESTRVLNGPEDFYMVFDQTFAFDQALLLEELAAQPMFSSNGLLAMAGSLTCLLQTPDGPRIVIQSGENWTIRAEAWA